LPAGAPGSDRVAVGMRRTVRPERGFDSSAENGSHARLAQLAERLAHTEDAGGSIPSTRTMPPRSSTALDACFSRRRTPVRIRLGVLRRRPHGDDQNTSCTPRCAAPCARSPADRAADYGSAGRGFDSLRAHAGQPDSWPARWFPLAVTSNVDRLRTDPRVTGSSTTDAGVALSGAARHAPVAKWQTRWFQEPVPGDGRSGSSPERGTCTTVDGSPTTRPPSSAGRAATS
jgi:hypothetical protein